MVNNDEYTYINPYPAYSILWGFCDAGYIYSIFKPLMYHYFAHI